MRAIPLGKVVVATAGTPVQLGKTTLNGDVGSGNTTITVASINGCPGAGSLYRIDSEDILVTGRSGTSWTVRRGMNGTTPASHSNGAAVTCLGEVNALKATVIAGLTGKCYLGCAGLSKTTFDNVVHEFWPNASGGVGDNILVPKELMRGSKVPLSDFWLDVAVSGEGLLITGFAE